MQNNNIDSRTFFVNNLNRYLDNKKIPSNTLSNKIYIFFAKLFGKVFEISNEGTIILLHKSDVEKFLSRHINKEHPYFDQLQIKKILKNTLNQSLHHNKLNIATIEKIKTSIFNNLQPFLFDNIINYLTLNSEMSDAKKLEFLEKSLEPIFRRLQEQPHHFSLNSEKEVNFF